MSIMDSAMFYPGRMGLTREQGLQQSIAIVANARRFGGTVVINWHDRSLVPERLWGWCYHELIAELELDQRTWFATAGEAVTWFRWRRSIQFDIGADGGVTVTAAPLPSNVPAARVIAHASAAAGRHSTETRFDASVAVRVSL